MNKLPVIIVQARMSSRRLPGKVLKPLAGQPMLSHTIERLVRCKKADRVLVATSGDSSDDPVAAYLADKEIECFRGSLNDVVGRMADAATSTGAESFVRVCGDSPFIDPEIVDEAIDRYAAGGFDLATNVFPRSYPRGMSVEVIRTATLCEIAGRSLTDRQREHVTTYFYDNPADFDIVPLVRNTSLEGYSFVVDDSRDFDRAERLFDAMGSSCHTAGLEQMIDIYDELVLQDS